MFVFCFSRSDQNAWQTLIAYDACVRLCLNAWARSCTEAPEFLKDECLVLRKAFGYDNSALSHQNPTLITVHLLPNAVYVSHG